MALSSERAAARRRHLVDTAKALIRERGDAGFSMALLAERAGVSAATPYNLLGSKSEILRLLVRDDVTHFIRKLEGEAGATPLASLLIATDRLVNHYESDHQFYIGVYRAVFSPAAPEVRGIVTAGSLAWWNTLVTAAIDSGEITDLVQPAQLTEMLLRMVGATTQTWLVEDWPADRFALEMSMSVRLVLASVCAPPQRTAMLRDIADLQAKVGTRGDTGQATDAAADVNVEPGTDRRAILASRAVIVAFRMFEQAARGAALTIPQYRFLLMLKRGPRRASDLAAFSGIGRPTASALIADMEQCGLIVRARGKGDGRSMDLRITDEGLRRYAVLEKTLAEAFGTLLRDDNREAILDIMARFSEGIDRTARERNAD